MKRCELYGFCAIQINYMIIIQILTQTIVIHSIFTGQHISAGAPGDKQEDHCCCGAGGVWLWGHPRRVVQSNWERSDHIPAHTHQQVVVCD